MQAKRNRGQPSNTSSTSMGVGMSVTLVGNWKVMIKKEGAEGNRLDLANQ